MCDVSYVKDHRVFWCSRQEVLPAEVSRWVSTRRQTGLCRAPRAAERSLLPRPWAGRGPSSARRSPGPRPAAPCPGCPFAPAASPVRGQCCSSRWFTWVSSARFIVPLSTSSLVPYWAFGVRIFLLWVEYQLSIQRFSEVKTVVPWLGHLMVFWRFHFLLVLCVSYTGNSCWVSRFWGAISVYFVSEVLLC